jgi:hypothetical protein
MSAHTPGPWMVSFDASRYGIYQCEEINGVQHRRTPIAFVPKLTKDETCPAEEHRTILQDARLIAAAPDMLNALRKAVVTLAGAMVHAPELDVDDAYTAVSDAIAKTTGERP